ncbi:RhoGEF domain protein [Ancylostoma ceylanicum]|uniref:RhoGEF domain protein n=1 Tax=Ancylostoma ceylanicum TaxID=53326 RepID=A0A0D6M2N0_9BILA|nr:RhoGEF domain protein [Ancylostoma ceylanicum]
MKLRLEEEWARFQEQLLKRKLILNAAVSFFIATKMYFNQLPSWVESPGVDPAVMNGKTAEVLEEAIQQHETFWALVEETYAEAFAQGSQLTQLLKSVDVDDSVSKEQLGKLTRAHKHLLCMWKERRELERWIWQVSEVMRNLECLRRSMAEAQSPVDWRRKWPCTVYLLRQCFKRNRFNLLNQSVLFHTHYHEIMAWYDEMEKKYAERVVDSDVESCERSKEQWLYESDGTAQAYATTIGEGTQLVHELEIHSQHTGIDYTSNISCINRLIRNIENRNSKLSAIWNPQRILLQIGLRFAIFVRDNCEVLSQIRSWEEDMRGMLESSTFAGNAEKVLPFHQDNTAQVKMAVKNIRKCAQEVLQNPDRDWCAVRVGETPQERVNVISELLSKHMDYKDRFLKGCIYAQKTSELFLKYIERTSTGYGVQNRCQQFVLMDATRHVLVDWLCGEGERRLSEFFSKGVADQVTLEDFYTFKLAVKVRLRFETFSRRVAECETILRGGKPSAKDDLSLDRLSDASVEENVNAMKREQNRKMKEPMQELIKSERDYIEDLRKCIQVYINEYDAAESNSTLPSVLKDRRHAIFGNYEKLYAFHAEKFIHELSKYEDDPEEVGCSFTVWVDYLNELYTDYCVNMEQNNYVVALPEAVSFFEAIREKHGLEQNNSLHSMRIKPVQRCTRYKLLMEQLLKHCNNVEEIREAYDVVKSLPRRVNDIIHFNGLEKDKVFLFEQAIVIAKKVEFTSKNVKYIIKGKPIPVLSSGYATQ